MTSPPRSGAADWPALPYAEWADTCATLHLWTQIVGKNPAGAYAPGEPLVERSALRDKSRTDDVANVPWRPRLQNRLRFIDHRLTISTCAGEVQVIPLGPRSVADFHAELWAGAGDGWKLRIWTMPGGDPDAIRSSRPHARVYDPDSVNRFWRIWCRWTGCCGQIPLRLSWAK